MDVRLTGTQAKVHDAVLAVLDTSPCVVLTGAARLGKMTVLAAALSGLAEPDREVLWFDDEAGGIAGLGSHTRMPTRMSSPFGDTA